MNNSITNAIKELKDDFKCQLDYLESLEFAMKHEFGKTVRSSSIEENLDYLIRDNSELKHNHTTETRQNAIQILYEFEKQLDILS